MNEKNQILRTPFPIRVCHWLLVICFLGAALSGLAWFFPTFSWLSSVFGTPQMARIMHPFFGIGAFFFLMVLFVRLACHNIPKKTDLIWLKHNGDVMMKRETVKLQVGKYNAGQKFLFWCIMALIVLLLITGLIIWHAYFGESFSIPLVRWALLAHSFAGICLMLLVIGHVYLAFWIKGSIKSMITGYVSRLWAKTHHDRWYDEVVEHEKQAGE